MSAHIPPRYVKTGLAGYGPDLDENDSPAESTRRLADMIRYELDQAMDMLADAAPIMAESGDYESAYGARVLADNLAILSRNLDWDTRATAPLYADNESALVATMETIVAESFPLDLDTDGRIRLYVWEAEPEPDQWADSTDAYPYPDGR